MRGQKQHQHDSLVSSRNNRKEIDVSETKKSMQVEYSYVDTEEGECYRQYGQSLRDLARSWTLDVSLSSRMQGEKWDWEVICTTDSDGRWHATGKAFDEGEAMNEAEAACERMDAERGGLA